MEDVNNAVDALQETVSRVALSRESETILLRSYTNLKRLCVLVVLSPYEVRHGSPANHTFVDSTVGILEVEVSIAASCNDAKTAELSQDLPRVIGFAGSCVCNTFL